LVVTTAAVRQMSDPDGSKGREASPFGSLPVVHWVLGMVQQDIAPQGKRAVGRLVELQRRTGKCPLSAVLQAWGSDRN